MERNAACFYGAAQQLPQCCAPLLHVPAQTAAQVTEIRIRSARPVVLSTAAESFCVLQSGALCPACDASQMHRHALLHTAHAQVTECFHALCGYSVHSHEVCIVQGFVPMRGGHRAGLCGTALLGQGTALPEGIKNITSLNIRIARPQLCTCAPPLLRVLGQTGGVLLAGPPGSGKTTLLRAVMQELSARGTRVAAVDERFEIAPIEASGFAAPPPLHCDVLSGYPKHIGMQHALRGLAPDVILCDEIGGAEDVQAVRSAANAGVRMLVTLHGSSRAEVLARPQVRALVQTGAFRFLVQLRGKAAPGEIEEVSELAPDA